MQAKDQTPKVRAAARLWRLLALTLAVQTVLVASAAGALLGMLHAANCVLALMVLLAQIVEVAKADRAAEGKRC